MRALAFTFLFSAGLPHSCPSTSFLSQLSMCSSRPSRIACIGDIHSVWTKSDETALLALDPDLLLFVGDFGDEDTKTTGRVASFAESAPFPVATVFGNHDAHFSLSPPKVARAPYDKTKECRVSTQLEQLQKFDVSYGSRNFSQLGLSLVGGRPFTAGGPRWNGKPFYKKFYGIGTYRQSVDKMMQTVEQCDRDMVVFLAHNGPTGLGDKPADICGKDFGEVIGGDYGDGDLREVIDTTRNKGIKVPLVVFGHMHSKLQKGRGQRTMVKEEYTEEGQRTVMVNTAVVPRRRREGDVDLGHVHIVELSAEGVDRVLETWISSEGEIFEQKAVYEYQIAA